MNQAYRVFWHQAREHWYIGNKHPFSAGLILKRRKVLSACIISALCGLPVTGWAVDTTISSGETRDSQFSLENNDDTLTVEQGGRVEVTENEALSVYTARENTEITNSGLLSANGTEAVTIQIDTSPNTTITNTSSGIIQATGEDAIAINLAGGLSRTLTNASTISGTQGATQAISIGSVVGINQYSGLFSGSLTNSGTINLTGTGGTGSNSAIDIYLFDTEGTLTNEADGVISSVLQRNDDQSFAAKGISIGKFQGQTMDGKLLNLGTITVDALQNDDLGDNVVAEGIFINVDVSGSGQVSNLGNIYARAVATGTDVNAEAYASGIVGGEGSAMNGKLLNDGTITAFAESASSYAEAIGIDFGQGSGNITNSGTLDITARSLGSDSNADAQVYGIVMNAGPNGLTGELVNSGTIKAQINAYDSADLDGIRIRLANGNITNSGSITASGASVNATATLRGISIGQLNKMLENSGTITVNSGSGDSVLYGIHVIESFDAAGILTNSGAIVAQATEGNLVTVNGIKVDQPMDGTLTNSGAITVTASSTNDASSVKGIFIDGDVTNSLTNSGTITVTGANDVSEVRGIRVSTLSGNLENSGTITATGTVQPQAIYVDNLTGTLNNSGTISGYAENPGDGYSLYIASGNSIVHNQAGGLLHGNLFTGGTVVVNNEGTIAIPAGATGSITGTYTQGDSGVFRTYIASASSYGKLSAGTVDLPSNAKIDVNVDNFDFSATQFDDVISAATILPTDNFVVTDSSGLFDFSASVFNDTLDLQMTAATGNTITGPGAAAYADIWLPLAADYAANGTTGNADMDLVFQTLARLSDDEIAAGVEQTLPLLTGGTTYAIGNALSGSNRFVQTRMNNNRGLSSGDMTLMDKHAWGAVYGSWLDQNDKDGVSGYDGDSYGFITGFDGNLDDRTNLGFAFAYNRTDIDSNSSIASGSADIETFQLVSYGRYALGNDSELSFQADISTSNTEGSRTIAFISPTRVARSDADSMSYHVGLDFSKIFTYGDDNVFIPSASLDYTLIDSDDYTETGAGALNLQVNDNRFEALEVGGDLQLEHQLNEKTLLSTNLGVAYDLIDENVSITSAYAGGGGTFVVKGIDNGPWVGRAGLGLTTTLDNGTEVIARYDIEAREDFDNQTLSVKARWAF